MDPEWQDAARPNFFIVGAPKCGTTSIAAWLSEHPNVCMSIPKEPKYFSPDVPGSRSSLKEYVDSFRHARPEHTVVGDASPRYLRSREAISRILAFDPDARFLVCIRDPVEMIQSAHNQLLYNGEEAITDLEEAWRVDEGRQLPVGGSYREYCSIGDQLQRMLAQVSRDKVHMVLLEDISSSPEKTYCEILDFLGLQRISPPLYDRLNRSKMNRSLELRRLFNVLRKVKMRVGFTRSIGIGKKIIAWNRVERDRLGISREFESELRSYFRPQVLLLQDLTHRDLSSWLDGQESLPG